ncbi:hypothetical protein J1N35_040626 [Gossypium stocksii]|uniref:Uncharacterized protein n=1 Tax=Gossypium stocksii TaxID=47602 RepID=A0A9D3UEG3_9ROSI|nr:hypothetical protein J1N35_040626 [Gossypium stocksii]
MMIYYYYLLPADAWFLLVLELESNCICLAVCMKIKYLLLSQFIHQPSNSAQSVPLEGTDACIPSYHSFLGWNGASQQSLSFHTLDSNFLHPKSFRQPSSTPCQSMS